MITFILLAAVSAWLVTRSAPQHRPIAWALTVCAALDAVRLLPLPARVDMALCVGMPAVSVWAYGRAFCGPVRFVNTAVNMWAPMVAWVIFCPVHLWHWTLPGAFLLSFVAGLVAITVRCHFPIRGEPWGLTQRVALILLAGDALAVATLCAREWISDQAGVVLGLVTVHQMAWYWRWKRASNIRVSQADQ
jgi:hypothetical protein